MNADDLLIAPSPSPFSSKFDCVPLLVSSTAQTLRRNTNFPSNLVIKGEILNISAQMTDTQNITSVSFPELTTISGSYALYSAFKNCTSLTSVSFPKLTTISGSYALYYAFNGCTSLTSVSFPELTTISGSYALYYAFSGCTSLTSVSFPKLTTISGESVLERIFNGCTSLTSVSFPELTTISNGYALRCIFENCTSLTSVSFPKLTTVTYPKSAFSGAGDPTLTIHLPKALSSLGITNGYGSNSSSYASFAYDL